MSDLIAAHDLHKSYSKGKNIVPVLRGASFGVRPGEVLAVVGSSGSGKSTLLHVLGLLDSADRGEIHFQGRNLSRLKRKEKNELRNQTFGFVFQFYHLMPELTLLENVLMPAMIRYGVWQWQQRRRECLDRARLIIDTVGLSHRLKHRPNELSGGEMQRVAIARALINEPELLLADEPTGNLDQDTGRQILELLRRLNQDAGLSIILVTHDPAVAAACDRKLCLEQGQLHAV